MAPKPPHLPAVAASIARAAGVSQRRYSATVTFEGSTANPASTSASSRMSSGCACFFGAMHRDVTPPPFAKLRIVSPEFVRAVVNTGILLRKVPTAHDQMTSPRRLLAQHYLPHIRFLGTPQSVSWPVGALRQGFLAIPCGGSKVTTDDDNVLIIPRMFSDDDGACRFDQVRLPLVVKEYAPPAAPVAVGPAMPVGRCVFMRIPPGWVGEQHPTPHKQLIVCLAGAVRFTGSGGATYILGPGQSLIDANIEGPGHTTEVVSDIPFEGYLITLE
jgi:hypothetical protein